MARKKKKRTQAAAELDTRRILKVFKEAGRPLATGEALSAMGMKKRDMRALKDVLKGLVREGKLIRTRGAWGLVGAMRMVTGRLEVKSSGIGFVIPDDVRRKDLFISEKDMNGAWHGDKVVAAVTRERKARNHEGRIVRIIERGRDELTVRVTRPLGKGSWLTHPTDPLLNFGVVVDGDGQKMPEGEVLRVRPGERVDPFLWEGELIARLGPEADLVVQEGLVKANHGIPTTFPGDVRAEAEVLPALPTEEDMAGRKDLRGIDFVTIDGADAKDFDDAVFVQRKGRGWRLWVAIADVSHYAKPGSALDREAYARGNSYYFPLSVEPMFPEKLSNGLCSLNPEVDRLAMAVRINYDERGVPHEAEFYNAVIRSRFRLTYDQVKTAILDGDAGERARIEPVADMLEEAVTLSKQIRARRAESGSLDFDIPEPRVVMDDAGHVTDIVPRGRHFAHQLIEAFMIAANEAVANYLESAGPGCLFRIHPAPDPEKLENLYTLLAATHPDIVPPKTVEVVHLQQLLKKVKGSDMEYLVNRMLLRSMKQAQYSPDNEGHFGLASECYGHFTSPIRRYADLVVHRLLKHTLGEEGGPLPNRKRLMDMAGQVNGRERTAVEGEREIYKRAAVLYLREREGEQFTGVISGMADFGFWVELCEVMAEGVVRLSGLHDDYYTYVREREMLVGQRTGKQFKLGQKLTVKLASVSLDSLEVELELVGEAGGEPRSTQGHAARSKGRPGARPKSSPKGHSRRRR